MGAVLAVKARLGNVFVQVLLGIWAVTSLVIAYDSLRASLYGIRLGEMKSAQAPADVIARAMRRVTELDPNNPEVWRLSADLSAQSEIAIGDARTSLHLGPARARTWLLLAWRQIRSGRGGEDLDRALWQASQLAPSDRPLQLSLAVMGLQYWAVGSDTAHGVWESAIRFSLVHEADELRQQAATRKLGGALCLGFVERYDLDPWCRQHMATERRRPGR